jgi:uncharacterized membrane protein YdjX (TVP38/TMEM64 family)
MQQPQHQQQDSHAAAQRPSGTAIAADRAALEPGPSTWRARKAAAKKAFCKVVCSPGGWRQITLCVLWWALVTVAVITVFAVLIPKALAGPIQALIALLSSKLTTTQIIVICMAAVVLLPCTLVLPMIPFIWVAGMALDFGRAYAIVMAASVVGMSLQYWLARYVFKARAERYLLERRKDGISVALRAVELAGPWKVVALVRLGPSPYALMNYLFGACPTIRFHQYIIASTLCIAHHRALSVFFGRAMPTLADLFSGRPVKDVGTAVYRIIVLVLGICICVCVVIWAKRALKKLQQMELEREEAEERARAAEEGTAGLDADGDAAAAAGRASLDAAAVAKKLEGVDAAAAGSGAKFPGSRGSEGDLVIVVDDAATTTGSSLSLSLSSDGSVTPPAGQQQQVQAPAPAAVAQRPLPPAALEAEPSRVSSVSSVSSLRGLLSARFQRSS